MKTHPDDWPCPACFYAGHNHCRFNWTCMKSPGYGRRREPLPETTKTTDTK